MAGVERERGGGIVGGSTSASLSSNVIPGSRQQHPDHPMMQQQQSHPSQHHGSSHSHAPHGSSTLPGPPPPAVAAATARLGDLLDFVRLECSEIAGQAERYKERIIEYERHAEAHLMEVGGIREQLSFLQAENKQMKAAYEDKLGDLKRQIETLRAANGTGPPIPSVMPASTNHFGGLMGHPQGMFGQQQQQQAGGSGPPPGSAGGLGGASGAEGQLQQRDGHQSLRNGGQPMSNTSNRGQQIPSMAMQLEERERERERQLAYEREREQRDREREAHLGKRARPQQEDVHMRDAQYGDGPPPAIKTRLGGIGDPAPANGGIESRTSAASASSFPPRDPSRTYPNSPHHQLPPGAPGTASGRSQLPSQHQPQQSQSHQQQASSPSVLQQAPPYSSSSSVAEAAKRAQPPQANTAAGGEDHRMATEGGHTASSATPAPAPVPSNTGVTAPAQRQKREDWDVVYSKTVDKALKVSLVHTFVHDSVVCCVRLSPDGKLLATGCNRNTTLYDTTTGNRIVQLVDPTFDKPDNYIRSVAFSPDGRTIATGSEDHQVRIWDIAYGKLKNRLEGHKSEIYSLAFTPEGDKLISGSGDKSAVVWDMETGRPIHHLMIEESRHNARGEVQDAGVTSVAISSDGRLLLAGSLDHHVRIWDIHTGILLERLKGHKDSVYSVAFVPGGKQILTGSLDKTLKIWDVAPLLQAMQEGESLDPNATRCSCIQTISGHKDFVLSVAATSDGQYVISGSKDRAVEFWSAKTGQNQFILHGHKNSVISIAMAESGGLLATGSGDWQARIFKITGLGDAVPSLTAPKAGEATSATAAASSKPESMEIQRPSSTAPSHTSVKQEAAPASLDSSASNTPAGGPAAAKSPSNPQDIAGPINSNNEGAQQQVSASVASGPPPSSSGAPASESKQPTPTSNANAAAPAAGPEGAAREGSARASPASPAGV